MSAYKANHLFFLTSTFPFGSQETFIETEILYLSKYFKSIIIISHDLNTKYVREVPENVDVFRLRYTPSLIEKLFSIRYIFHPLFWHELRMIKNVLKLNIDFGKLKTLLISLQNASRLKLTYQKKIKKYKSQDTLFYSYWLNDSALALSMLKSENSNYKVISRMHRWDIYFEENKYKYLPMRNYILSSLDKVYSISFDGISYTNSLLGFELNNLKLSRLGIEKTQFEKKNKTKGFFVVSCSNIIEVKRVQLIAESLATIENANIKWVHFGDGPLMKSLINFCERNFKNNIDYNFLGRISNLELFSYYKNNYIDLFINLSASEGIPVSIMEALSFGIPVLATNVGGTQEIVNNKNGFLINSNPSVEEVGHIINKFLQLSQTKKDKMRLEAYQNWEKNYNAEKNYNLFSKEIASL